MMLPYIKIDAYLLVYMEFIFSFYQEIALSFMLFGFVFSILTIFYFRLFCKVTCIFLSLVFTFIYVFSSTSKKLL